MKLDKIAFAYVVARCVNNGMFADRLVIEELECLIDIDVSVADPVKVDPNDVDSLLDLMAKGKQKIEAIKAYRSLTGVGLKESKDAVERYWISKPVIEGACQQYQNNLASNATLGDILGNAVKK
jgi:Ribosomal protein L7/L12 C-terminal domain